MELWDGLSQVVWHNDGGGPLGRSDEDITLTNAPATAGVVLRCARQKGGASSRRRCDAVLCAVGVVDLEPLAAGRTPSGRWRMDATTLSDRFTVLCISVLSRGCAIPVAWKLMRGGEKGSWEPYWKTLFSCLKGSVPKEWTVIVLADRGLYARLSLPPHRDARLASVLAHQSGRQGADARGGEI